MRVFLGYNVNEDETAGPRRLLDVVEDPEEMTADQLANSVELPDHLVNDLVQTGNEYITSESLVIHHLRRSGQPMPAGVE